MAALFGDESSDSESQNELVLNEEYAKKYDKWREKEELQKLKDKYGEDATLDLLSSSSSEESEDEDAVELTSEVEKKFLETLSALKSKDPKIYSKDVVFFEEPEPGAAEAKKRQQQKRDKPMYLKDYERKIIVEKEGVLSDEEDDGASAGKTKRRHSFATAAEEEELKKSFKAALRDSDEEEDDDEGLLKTRQNSKKEQAEEEEEYVRWLKGEVQKVEQEEVAQKMGYLHDYWNSGHLEKSEDFLRDYILNKRYLEKSRKAPSLDEGDLSEDEAALEQQETFEHKYNYRFEEPDAEFIKKYPRTLQDSMRRKDDRRKQKREEIRERKLQEKAQKREEIKQLKALKRKEIMEKLEKLKEITGNDQLAFSEADLEGDFDPEEYDRLMNNVFNSEYYSQECDEQKPEHPVDEELEVENWDNWRGEEGDGGEDDGEFDGAYEGMENGDRRGNFEEWGTGAGVPGPSEDDRENERQGKRRKKSHFAKTVAKQKPLFDPTTKSFEEYFDEYYNLDFEDVVGGMPTRFHYRKVVPNDFGLSVEEILSAKDKELNRWCSVKKTCQYRTDNEEKQDLQTFQRRAHNEALKRKIFASLYQSEEAEEAATVTDSKQSSSKKRKKRRKQAKQQDGIEKTENTLVPVEALPEEKKWSVKSPAKRKANVATELPESATRSSERDGPPRNKKKKKKKAAETTVGALGSSSPGASKKKEIPLLRVSENRLRAYGLNPRKVHRQRAYGGKKQAQ